MASESVREVAVPLPWKSGNDQKGSRLKGLLSCRRSKQKTLPRFLREVRPLLSQKNLAASLQAAMNESEGVQLHQQPRLSILATSIAALKARSLIGKPTRPPVCRRKQLSYSELEPKQARESQVVDLLRSIQDSSLSATILAVARVVLYFQDLQPLVLNQDPPRKVLQAFFSYLNQGNKSLYQGVKVKIYSLTTVQELLQLHPSAPTKRSPMTYDTLVFPIFTGHWMLLVAKTSDQSLTLLDPLKKSTPSADMFKAVIRFLQLECKRHSTHHSNNLHPWTEAFMQTSTETAHFPAAQSGLYVMKRAEGVARCCGCDLEKGALKGYGAYVLDKLVRTSLRRAN